MNLPAQIESRHSALSCAAALVLKTTATAWALPSNSTAARSATVAQIVDTSPQRQDFSEDFPIASTWRVR
jgi:hypothetical protein